jgi:hypothetical protein
VKKKNPSGDKQTMNPARADAHSSDRDQSFQAMVITVSMGS